MPQSLARLHLHLIFSTKHREQIISDRIRDSLHAYMATVLQNMGCPTVLINSVEDHVHILFELARTVAVSSAVESVKKLLQNGSKRKDRNSLDSHGRRGMVYLLFPNPTSLPSANTSQGSANIIEVNHFRKNTGRFWNGIGSLSMNGMYGIEPLIELAPLGRLPRAVP